MHILLVTTDLLAASQFEGAARTAGAALQTAAPALAVEAAKSSSACLVVFDLTAKLEDLAEKVAELKTLQQPPAVIAFGPHVQEKKLSAAAEAGCDAVLTRGQFHRQAAEVIARYVSDSASDSVSEGNSTDAGVG